MDAMKRWKMKPVQFLCHGKCHLNFGIALEKCIGLVGSAVCFVPFDIDWLANGGCDQHTYTLSVTYTLTKIAQSHSMHSHFPATSIAPFIWHRI